MEARFRGPAPSEATRTSTRVPFGYGTEVGSRDIDDLRTRPQDSAI